MAKAAIVINSIEELADSDVSASLFFESVAAAGMSHKEVAYAISVDPATLSRMRSGQVRIALQHLLRLPASASIEFARRWHEAKGIATVSGEDAFAEQAGHLLAALLKFKARRSA